MPKIQSLVHPSAPPANQAMVFICEKCGKRVGDKHRSHRLASKLKRSLRDHFSKGDIRIVLTSCMDVCPEDRIAVSMQPAEPSRGSIFWEVDVEDLEQVSEALSRAVAAAIADR